MITVFSQMSHITHAQTCCSKHLMRLLDIHDVFLWFFVMDCSHDFCALFFVFEMHCAQHSFIGILTSNTSRLQPSSIHKLPLFLLRDHPSIIIFVMEKRLNLPVGTAFTQEMMLSNSCFPLLLHFVSSISLMKVAPSAFCWQQ